MAQQFDVVLNIQLQHEEQIMRSIQVCGEWEDIVTDLKISLTDRNKSQDLKKQQPKPKPIDSQQNKSTDNKLTKPHQKPLNPPKKPNPKPLPTNRHPIKPVDWT